MPRYRRGGTAFPPATAHGWQCRRRRFLASQQRIGSAPPPFLLYSVEIIISSRAAETIELCVEKVLVFISTEYRRKGDRDIATTSSIEMVNDIVRDGL